MIFRTYLSEVFQSEPVTKPRAGAELDVYYYHYR